MCVEVIVCYIIVVFLRHGVECLTQYYAVTQVRFYHLLEKWWDRDLRKVLSDMCKVFFYIKPTYNH